MHKDSDNSQCSTRRSDLTIVAHNVQYSVQYGQSIDKELVLILVHLYVFTGFSSMFAGLIPAPPGYFIEYLRTLPFLHDEDYAKRTDLNGRYPPLEDLSEACVLP